MSTESCSIVLSELDEHRWGIPTARAVLKSAADMASALEFCRIQQVGLLIARVPTAAIRTVQSAEGAGFELMDTLAYYERILGKAPLPIDSCTALLRPFQPGDEGEVEEVARQSFKGYSGHYHADTRLDPIQCDEVYVDWAIRSCLPDGSSNGMVVAEKEGNVVAFATLRLDTPREGEGVLFAVSPAAQGQGLYRGLLLRGMQWCLDRGARRMVVSTQITNVVVQKHWARLGFEFRDGYYTLHKWFHSA